MDLNFNSQFGSRASKRLHEEDVIWLTTVRKDGMPLPNPVWFYWDGETILFYTLPDSQKLRNIRTNAKISLHFNSTPDGGDVQIFQGEAAVDPGQPPAHQNPAYFEKYSEAIQDINMTPESFSQSYSVPVRVKITRMRGF